MRPGRKNRARNPNNVDPTPEALHILPHDPAGGTRLDGRESPPGDRTSLMETPKSSRLSKGAKKKA